MIIVVYLIFGAIFAFITSGMATRRGRSGGLWGILGFFFGIFAMLLLLIIGNASSGVASSAGHQFIAPPAPSKFDEIAKLKALLDSGVLTQDEFETQKRKLLG
jgi:Short C-terminal domain